MSIPSTKLPSVTNKVRCELRVKCILELVHSIENYQHQIYSRNKEVLPQKKMEHYAEGIIKHHT